MSRSYVPGRTPTGCGRVLRTPSCDGADRIWWPTSGRWRPQDGVDLAVRAADHIVHERGRRDISFTLIGSGDSFAQLVALRDELGLEDYVEFTGRVSDETVARILSTADVGLCPDPKNPLNDVSTMNKTMEYMAFALPVVAFDLHETRVSAGDAAVYASPNEVADLARLVVELIDDEPRRRSMGALGRARVGRQLWPGRTSGRIMWASTTSSPVECAGSRSRSRARRRGLAVCGIAGCYQQVDGEALARTMIDRMAHRGPDDEGFFNYQRDQVSVQLAHRRLSIIDLSAGGHQPLTVDGLTLCYNGELYNYRALRAELAGLGVRFSTNSDNEVVLEAWRRWGPECLRRFRGMFAFAIFDERTGDLVLGPGPAGDQAPPLPGAQGRRGLRLRAEGNRGRPQRRAGRRSRCPGGVAPLLLGPAGPVCHRGRGEAGARSVGRVPSRRHVHRHLVLGHRRSGGRSGRRSAGGPAGGHRGVRRRPPGRRTCPCRAFLSGGLDSSIVTVLAKQADSAIDAYTITFRPEDHRLEAMPDDAVYARKVAARFGIELHEIETSPDIVDLLPRIVDVLDEPVGDPAAINTLLMCEAARDAGVKVVLSGMGADELFGGYRKHLACLLAARYRHLPSVVRGSVRRVADHVPVVAGGRGLRYARWTQAVPHLLPSSPRRPPSGAATPSTTHPNWPPCSARTCAPASTTSWPSTTPSTADTSLDDPVDRMCLADARLFLPGLNLAYTDRASMAASVEVRVPFVDPAVVQAAFSMPGPAKIRGRTTQGGPEGRRLTRGCPAEIVHRPKASFGGPAAGVDLPRLGRAGGRRAPLGRPGRAWLPPAGAAAAAGRRRAQRSGGSVQADLATPHARAVVPAGRRGRSDDS